MKIAQSKTRDQFPLHTRKVLKKTILSVMGWFIILVIALSFLGVLYFSDGNSAETQSLIAGGLIVSFVGFLIIALIIYLYQKWYYAVYFYDLTDNFIIIKKGPITPHEITIPYERVQDVYVDQDILDRILGLYDVHLSSATAASGMQAHIDGVGKEAADGLRDLLLNTVHQKLNKNRQAASAQTPIAPTV